MLGVRGHGHGFGTASASCIAGTMKDYFVPKLYSVKLFKAVQIMSLKKLTMCHWTKVANKQ